MNSEVFKKEIERSVAGSPMDITLLSKWFSSILESLKVLHEQKAGIRHPRYRGDAREADLIKAIRPIFPPSVQFGKGFVLDNITAHSREQDILLLNAATASAVVESDGCSYYPIESVLGSIEVKSRLNLTELRKAILNCISVKKLLKPMREEASPLGEISYAIFAYASDWDLKASARRVDAAVADVPEHLRPDAIYILGEGLLIPGAPDGLELRYRQSKAQGYQGLPGLKTELLAKSEAYAFLWFVTSLVEHCVKEAGSRLAPSIFSYLIQPIGFQLHFEKAFKADDPEGFARLVEARRVRA